MEQVSSQSQSSKYVIFPQSIHFFQQIVRLSHKTTAQKGFYNTFKNYHPISLLPLISKIIEKVIHDQTQAFLDENKKLNRFHRTNFSTYSCLSYLNSKITPGSPYWYDTY